ncbi:hypothetical protein HJFPF1_11593 [Paramyrothecium foliicola]|nr:hypothetical protein HJFPF1_11593 [Paramyrothecium foliicola]
MTAQSSLQYQQRRDAVSFLPYADQHNTSQSAAGLQSHIGQVTTWRSRQSWLLTADVRVFETADINNVGNEAHVTQRVAARTSCCPK